ncbi:MAG TPA: hypothetical protein VF598_08050 [Hymenobacter sp.]|jgi:hypothetical protein
MPTFILKFWSTVAFALCTQLPAFSTSASLRAGKQGPVVRRPAAPPTWKPTADSVATPNYPYRTRFRKAVAYPLQAAGHRRARTVYSCPARAAVYVLSQSAGSYTKVAVNGRVGYVASEWLADIR